MLDRVLICGTVVGRKVRGTFWAISFNYNKQLITWFPNGTRVKPWRVRVSAVRQACRLLALQLPSTSLEGGERRFRGSVIACGCWKSRLFADPGRGRKRPPAIAAASIEEHRIAALSPRLGVAPASSQARFLASHSTLTRLHEL